RDWISLVFFFSSRRRHTRFSRDWSSDVCSSDLVDPHLVHPEADGFERSRRAQRDRTTFVVLDQDAEHFELIRCALALVLLGPERSEERRVGKECSYRQARHDGREEEKRGRE